MDGLCVGVCASGPLHNPVVEVLHDIYISVSHSAVLRVMLLFVTIWKFTGAALTLDCPSTERVAFYLFCAIQHSLFSLALPTVLPRTSSIVSRVPPSVTILSFSHFPVSFLQELIRTFLPRGIFLNDEQQNHVPE